MTTNDVKMSWNGTALKKYEAMIEKIPIFHREMTKRVVPSKAEINAHQRHSDQVEEEDIVKAFIEEVPKAFYSLMIRLMGEVGFEYQKYEKEQNKQ